MSATSSAPGPREKRFAAYMDGLAQAAGHADRRIPFKNYVKLPSNAMGKQHAIEFLRRRYGDDIVKLNHAWEVEAKDFTTIPLPGKTDAYRTDAEQFLAGVAKRYF